MAQPSVTAEVRTEGLEAARAAEPVPAPEAPPAKPGVDVEQALAHALSLAVGAQRWDVVTELARALAARGGRP